MFFFNNLLVGYSIKSLFYFKILIELCKFYLKAHIIVMITITHKTVRIYFFFADALNGCKESEAYIREFATKKLYEILFS